MMKLCLPLVFMALLFVPGTMQRREGDELQVRPKLSVLIISTPDAGHFFPLVTVGRALAERGHNVTFCTTDRDDFNRQEVVTQARMNFISAGLDHYSIEDYLEFHRLMAYHPFRNGDTAKRYYATVSQQILTHLNSLSKTWDVMVFNAVFFSAASCFTSYHHWNIPMIVTTSALAGADLELPQWPFPKVHTDYTDNLTFWQRLHLKLMETVVSTLEPYMSQHSRLGLACSPYYYRFSDAFEGMYAPLIVFSAIGFDYPQPVLPMVHFVGPVIAASSSQSVPPGIQDWLAKKEDSTVIYISMGSTAQMSKAMGSAIIDGILRTNFSALWSLRVSNQYILNGRDLPSSRFFISHWVPQQAVLKSAAIAMTITHGGMGGVTESVYHSKPVIVVPSGTDQPGNAAKVARAGAGVYLKKDTITAEKVEKAIETVSRSECKKAAEKLKKIFIHAGGAEKAAELVEFYVDVGHEHLIPSYIKYNWSWLQYYNADVYAFLTGCLLLGLFLLYKAIAWSVRKCSGQKAKVE